MRFEIGSGGMLVILLGLAGLSGAVFGLGLVAGHELSGPEPGSQSVVAAYPLPPAAPGSAPAAAPAEAPAPPVNAGSTAASASGSTGVGTTGVGTNEAAVNPSSRPVAGGVDALKAPAPAASALRKSATSKNAVASRGSRTSAAATASDEDLSTGAAVAPPPEPGSASAEPTGADEEEPESAPAAPPHRRMTAVNPPAPRAASGPYSVQIDAMMDLQGAQEMARKIKAKGFQPFVVQTQVEGKTWYRLRVGHYATPEEAQAAESRLHQEFNQNPPPGN
jgi:septal ring-binding cell division protein DamX